ncbi:MAG: hypothetical protein ACSHXW_15805 [Yoonia sp.]
MGRAPVSEVASSDRTTAAPGPSAHVRAIEEASQRYLDRLIGPQRSAVIPAELAQRMQQSAGNHAILDLEEVDAEITDATSDVAKQDRTDNEEPSGRAETDEEEDDSALLPDPDVPTPADPATDSATEDETPSAADTPPAQTQDTPPANTPPAAPSGAGGGGSVAVAPAGGGAAGVVQAARATAAGMPQPVNRVAPASDGQQPPRRRRLARRQIAGPPPVPRVQADFATVEDKTAEQTRAIAEIAARRISRPLLPDIPPSPGENTVSLPAHPLSPEERRFVSLGSDAMDRARLSQPNQPPLPGERKGGETRARLLAIRNELLGIEPEPKTQEGAEAEDTQTVAPVQVGASNRPAAGTEEDTSAPTYVEAEAPPSEDITLAEQEMFTAVIANLKGGGDEAAERLVDRAKQGMSEYPNVLTDDSQPALDNLAKNLVPDLKRQMDSRVDGVAELIGIAGGILDNAVAERRRALAARASEDASSIRGNAQISVLAVAATADARLADAEAARQSARDASQRANSAGDAPDLGFRRIAEAGIARIQAKVSEAIAGFQMQGRQLKTDLDYGKARLYSALDLAVLADQFDAETAAGLVPGQPHPVNLERHKSNAILTAIDTATTWRTAQRRNIDAAITSAKAAVDRDVAAKTTEVQNAGAEAFRALRDWGNGEDEANTDWWQQQVANLDQWADNAHDTAETWAQTESRLARMELQLALQRAQGQIQAEIRKNEEENAAYEELTGDQRRNFLARNILNTDQLIQTVGDPLRDALFMAKKQRITSTAETQLFALPRGEWAALNAAAQAKNGNFNAQSKARTIHNEGADRVGTGEKEIFDALSGLRPIERLAVTACYNAEHGENALYRHLDAELSGDEWRRAQHLMEGEHGAAAAEAIHDAVFGPGTSEEQILAVLEQLNQLPPAERNRAIAQADATYRAQYGESLSSRLSGDLSGSEAGRALALAAANIDGSRDIMAEARAHELNSALGSHDANAAAEVYADIQAEVLATAREEGWTRAEYQAAVRARNQAMEREFGRAYSGVTNYNWGDDTTLQEAIGWNFLYDEGSRNRLRALQGGDLVGAAAGEMQSERRSFYADDEVMGGVINRQYQIAADAVDLDIGYDLRNGVTRRLNAEVRRRDATSTPMTAEEIRNRRMELDRDVNRTLANAAFDVARGNVAALNQRLVDRYDITLDRMIESTMSDNVFGQGGDLSNARDRLEIMRSDAGDGSAPDNRRLDWAYVRLRSGIEGGGTDVPELRDTLGGLTRAEIAILNKRWQNDHDNETLREAIEWDTSGRDEGDLVYLFDHGMPKTVQEQVDALRDKVARDEEDSTFLGAWASQDESRETRQSLRELEALAARMRDPNLSPDQREHLSRRFDGQRLMVDNAIEAERRAVDTFADTVTTVIGYVVAAVVIIASAVVTVVSGGTGSPALVGAIALAGSIIGTASTVAAKAAIKGGAYGLEEVGTDLAVGAVDLAVTLATMGLLKGGAIFRNVSTLFRTAASEIRFVTQQAIRQGLRAGAAQTGRTAARTAGREFARGQALEVAQSIPSTLTANFLNEDNWVHGNFAENMLRGTWEGTLQNLRDGVIMGAAGHVVNTGATRSMHVPLTERQALDTNLRHWRHANPDAPPAAFARYVEAQAAANSEYATLIRQAQREARRSLLSEIPPRERGGVADVPIIHVTGPEFRRFNGGNLGDAMVHIHNGQAVIIIRDGAPPGAVAAIGPQLRDIVSPGTRGRTVNPADSLPPRLRNRIDVETVSSDPTFGADEVRAVPQRDRDGNIIGVALQVGPNARAVDIALHVDTVDAMRRYVGLAGEIRMFMNRMGRRMGMDIVDPSELARWEATLEVAKLPRIIDERILRLSERGLDPRRKALVMEEIANLERQFIAEVARAEPGASGQARGYVAAKSQGDLDAAQVRDRDSDSDVDTAGEPANETSSPVDSRAQLESIAAQIRARKERLQDLQPEIDRAIDTNLNKARNSVRNDQHKYAQALERLKAHLPDELHPFINQSRDNMVQTARNHLELAKLAEFEVALASLSHRDRTTIRRNGRDFETIAKFEDLRARNNAERPELIREIAELRQEFSDLGGKDILGVSRHPDLPEPSAGIEYRPRDAFVKKWNDLLDPDLAKRLREAIFEIIDKGSSQDLKDMIADEDIQKIIADKLGGEKKKKTIQDVLAQVIAHREGYRSEVSLASQIAEGIDTLPGAGGHLVLDYGDPIGRNFADVLSVDADGNVFLWDSKYRGEGSTKKHSDTFTDGPRRATAAKEALRILENAPAAANLSESARAAAIKNLKAGNFYTVTSHTNDVSTFRHEIQTVEDHQITSTDPDD